MNSMKRVHSRYPRLLMTACFARKIKVAIGHPGGRQQKNILRGSLLMLVLFLGLPAALAQTQQGSWYAIAYVEQGHAPAKVVITL
jgi:hypothetical protein